METLLASSDSVGFSSEIGFVLGIVLCVVLLFVFEILPIDLTGLLVMIVIAVGGMVLELFFPPGQRSVLTSELAVRGFGNKALLTVAAMFVVSAGLSKTGSLTHVGKLLLRAAETSRTRFFFLLLVIVVVLSAFMNNTPVVVVFLPLVLKVARSTGIPASKLLMPLSFASILGGVCTLIGTSVNIVVSDYCTKIGAGGFSMFELTPVGGVAVIVGVLYLVVIGQRLVPLRTTFTDSMAGERITDYMTEVQIDGGSPLVGKPLSQTLSAPDSQIRVLEVIRESVILQPDADLLLEAGDLLLIKGTPDELYNLQQSKKAAILPDHFDNVDPKGIEASMAEVVITPDSRLNGRRIGDIAFRDRYGVSVFAVQRHGLHIREQVRNITMRIGDTLLVQGSPEDLNKLSSAEAFLLLEGVAESIQRKHKAPFAVGISLITILLISFEILPAMIAAMLGASLMVILRCITIKEAYNSLNLQVLILLAGMIGLGAAMDETGAAQFIAENLLGFTRGWGPEWTLFGIYLITVLLTEAVSNAATAVLMCPIAVSTALGLGVDPKPFLIAVCFAASFSFMTPVGYQTNTLVYGPGGYRFSDYARVGLPLTLLVGAVAILMIPRIWPL